MPDPAPDLQPDPSHDQLPDLRSIAVNLRAEGLTRAQIARSLAVSTWRVTELLAGEPPRSPGLRAQAKDDLHERARELRSQGRTYAEIVAELGVSKSSVSLWTRDQPKPPPRERSSYEYQRIAAARRAQWDEYLRRRDEERTAVKTREAAWVGELTDREALLVGTALYWAEGAKDKPFSRRESLNFTNSDSDLIRVYLRWLELLGIAKSRIGYRLSIHESADLPAAHTFCSAVVGVPVERFARPSLKRHNPRTVRLNIGDDYHGCCVVRAAGSRVEYQRMEGLWRGIVKGLSGVV